MLLEECSWICGSKQNVEFNFLANFLNFFLRGFIILTADQEIESNQTDFNSICTFQYIH